ncbi:ester cyclase [Roseobacter sp. HKCCA0434]|uniref:ester cyclase n=1 Tax=Roseobacter sp. HKCCA0434 TaxID=3079297 RepID=UPI002905DA3F|nr:ester cyclase [Roseobacter sp. HKCCA0434]
MPHPHDTRERTAAAVAALVAGGPDAGDALAADAVFHVGAPVGRLDGRDAVLEGWFAPLRAALTAPRLRDDIVIGGENRRDYGGEWVACVSHLAGLLTGTLWGIEGDGRYVSLRIGAFYRIEGARIVEARIIPDLVDLMAQLGRHPLPLHPGREIRWPAPMTHDGVCPTGGNGAATLDLVEAMLGDLTAYDPETFQSAGQTGPGGYWAEDMCWYGPGGIGSTTTYPGFDAHHRVAFLTAFPDRVGGNHYCRIGDGAYAAVSGWPSMTMTHRAPYLGQPGDGRALTLRVMDFYRCADSQIAENWVLLDYIDLFAQMGRDLIAERGAARR